jgi:hypothetical protein
MTATMVAVPIADTMEAKRLIEFASDVTRLADERRDLELRELVNELHFDLLILKGDDATWRSAPAVNRAVRAMLRSRSRRSRGWTFRPWPSRTTTTARCSERCRSARRVWRDGRLCSGHRGDPMHVHQRRIFEKADYDGWRIGVRPIIADPCRCEHPTWYRDVPLGVQCVKCGRRRSQGLTDGVNGR